VPLSYSWTFGDGGTSTRANPTHTYQAPGQYIARLTVSDGTSTAVSSNLTIRVGTPPTPTILTSATGTLFQAGDAITFSGSATDAEDGPLPASAFSWTLLFRHDSHIHPGPGPFTNTTSGTLQIPTSGHDFEGNTRYEIVLTVTDSTGLTASTSVTVFPDKVNLTYDTVPSGLTVTIDGISRQTPFVVDDLKGFQHTIDAPNQSNGGLRTPSPRGPTEEPKATASSSRRSIRATSPHSTQRPARAAWSRRIRLMREAARASLMPRRVGTLARSGARPGRPRASTATRSRSTARARG
jgi:PKD repeat protein